MYRILLNFMYLVSYLKRECSLSDVGALPKAETMMTPALVVVATFVMATTLANPLGKTEHFKIGFLAPWNTSVDDFSALTSASAISIALERIHADPTLNKSMRFRSVNRCTAVAAYTARCCLVYDPAFGSCDRHVTYDTNQYKTVQKRCDDLIWLLRLWPKNHCHYNLTIIECFSSEWKLSPADD